MASATNGWGSVNHAVEAVGTSYDDFGRVERITSYHDAEGTSVANDVLYAYDGWGNVQSIAQAHDGAADAASPAVHYAYEDGADANGAAAYLRLGSVTYPDGRAVAYNYGTTGGTDDILSRVASIDNDDATETYAQYAYMGASTIVAVNHPDVGTAGLLLTYDPAGDNTLTGLDRFGRVVDQLWTEGETTVDGFSYEYDPAGNRTSKTNVGNGDFSETYAYDGLDRLIDTNRDGADLQSWQLDSLGNWNSTTTASGTQTRTFDEANQITSINEDNTATSYDNAGNMTAGPADRWAPSWFILGHWLYDVQPFLMASRLDGGTFGAHVRQYISVRPISKGGGTCYK